MLFKRTISAFLYICKLNYWNSVVCMAQKRLQSCPTMDGVLGDLLTDLDQGISELLDSVRCNLTASDGLKLKIPEVCYLIYVDWFRCGLDLGQVSMRTSLSYLFRHSPGTGCILLPHEAGHCCAPIRTEDPLQQCRAWTYIPVPNGSQDAVA